MLYKKNNTPKLDMDLFQNPTSEYRGTPFWAWNCKLEKEELERQIEVLKEMGFGGFHMHSRAGMATTYLSEEFMNLVKACRDKAEKEQMLAWLYDEDRWPSGAAGGYVTKNKAFRQKILVFSENPVEFYPKEEAVANGLPYLLAVFDATLENGRLKAYRQIGENESAVGVKRYAYVIAAGNSGWYNGQAYVDTMSNEAMQKFIDITYESYKDAVGESFGDVVPAIFTDEPQVMRKCSLPYAEGHHDGLMPWTTDFNETYKEKYGEDLISKIPEIFWDLSDGRVSVARYHYHDHVCDRFTNAFAKQCGTWCHEHGIALTGHMMEEPTLESQTHSLSEAMRAYEWFEIPGIDLLCNSLEITTAKQCQSAVHQYGKQAMLSELYGVTNWDFDFRGHKYQGDWQAALGVTVRVPHLSWVSMKGSAKRDYPASINYQAPWYKEYHYVEDHFARLNTVLTRGKPQVDVGVIHPIESFWLYYGPQDTGSQIRKVMEDNFANISMWLCDGMVDYDFISEALLPKQVKDIDDTLAVGEMKYKTILVPACKTLRRTTWEILKDFRQKGGKLIFAGECPQFIDAVPSEEIRELYDAACHVPFDRLSILEALKEERTAEILDGGGHTATGYLHALRQDGDVRWFFMAHHSLKTAGETELVRAIDGANSEQLTLIFNGEYQVKLYNTIDGKIENIEYETKNGKTYVYKTMFHHDSLLLQLTEGTGAYKNETKKETIVQTIRFLDTVPYARDEENVVLLDMAEYKADDGAWQEKEELLKIDQALRATFGYPLANGKEEQPWVIPDSKPEHYVTLRFCVKSETEVENVWIAGEEAEYIKLNGEEIALVPDGYYTDKAILKYSAGKLQKGENIMEIKTPITGRIGLENYFLLGDFDVRVQGSTQTVCPQSEHIGFSDITSQGMPFYGGNIVYKTEINVPASTLKIYAYRYRGALIKVFVDGEPVGNIVYAPYVLSVDVEEGAHTVEFKLFGNRVNTFGPIHNSARHVWVGPAAWYTGGYQWSYEYEPKPTGIISSPRIEVIKK